jgi:hypothetical protein
MQSRAALAAALLAVAIAGCGSAKPTTTSTPKTTPAEAAAIQRTEERLQVHEAAETKRKAAKRASLKRKLHAYEQSPEYKKIQAEMRQGREYEQTHKGEEEAHEHEYERRARGELTPEEQNDQAAREREASVEAEAIREGERLKEEGR